MVLLQVCLSTACVCGGVISLSRTHTLAVIVRMLHGVMEVLFSSNTIVLFSNNGADEGGGGNDESLSVPEMLAKYMDGVLRGRVKDVDVLRLVPLVSFVTAKDLFFEEYRQALASRLLSNVSSLEDEQEVISHMKALCGGGMSSLLIKHETMITNVVMANEEKDSFESDDGLKLNMRVLTSSHWPSFLSLSCPLPPDMQVTWLFSFILRFRSCKKHTTCLYAAHILHILQMVHRS